MKAPKDTVERLALRPAEVAEALGLSERTIREVLPEIPHVRFGRAVVVPIDLLRQWLREQAQRDDNPVAQAVEGILDGVAGQIIRNDLL